MPEPDSKLLQIIDSPSDSLGIGINQDNLRKQYLTSQNPWIFKDVKMDR